MYVLREQESSTHKEREREAKPGNKPVSILTAFWFFAKIFAIFEVVAGNICNKRNNGH